MKLLLKRIAKRDTYTIGKLYIDGQYFCDTIEDKDRGLKQSMSLSEILRLKIQNKTAIPTGTYKITINVVSPRFSKKDFYIQNANKGRVPRLLNIPGFDGVLMHVGTDENSSSGCIIVGKNKIVGKVLESKDTFIKLYKKLQTSSNNITITIE